MIVEIDKSQMSQIGGANAYGTAFARRYVDANVGVDRTTAVSNRTRRRQKTVNPDESQDDVFDDV
jgi:hypothetical protein